MENNEFMKYIEGLYKNLQDLYYKEAPTINSTQRGFGFREFYDMGIRANNATMEGAKYLKKRNMNYSNKDLTNPDGMLMGAWEVFVFKKYNEAINEFFNYIKDTNEIWNAVRKKIGYKLLTCGNLTIARLVNKRFIIKDFYMDVQKHVDRYYEIGDFLSNINVDEYIEEAAVQFAQDAFNYAMTVDLSNTSVEEKDERSFRYQLYHCHIADLMLALTKIKKFNRIQEIADIELENINNNFEEYKKELLLK